MRVELSHVAAQTRYFLSDKSIPELSPDGSPQTFPDHEEGCAGKLENVHDMVHNFIGPDMANGAAAGWDPVLYFFHSNIDRQLQEIIITKGKSPKGSGDELSTFFEWFNQDYAGRPTPADMTFLHHPAAYPPELIPLLKKRLHLKTEEETPVYKDCFNLNYFNYQYKSMEGAFLTTPIIDKPPSNKYLVVVEFPADPTGCTFSGELYRHTESGEKIAIGRMGRFGMAMMPGDRMRQPAPHGKFSLRIWISKANYEAIPDDCKNLTFEYSSPFHPLCQPSFLKHPTFRKLRSSNIKNQ